MEDRDTENTMKREAGSKTMHKAVRSCAYFSDRGRSKKADELVSRLLVHDQQIILSEEIKLAVHLVHNSGCLILEGLHCARL